MYFRTSDEDTTCSQCDHLIAAGSLCMSIAPIGVGEDEAAEPVELATLHVRCEQCRSGESCLMSYASQQSPIPAPEEGVCAYCQHEFQIGHPILLESVLVVDEEAQESDETQEPDVQTESRKIETGSAVSRWAKRGLEMARESGAGAVAAAKSVPANFPRGFKDLTPKVQGRFARAGLRSWWKSRSFVEAGRFYESSVPRFVRNLGKTEEFIKGKSASHIESVRNAMDKARSNTNILWESEKANWSRGPRNMTRFEILKINAKNSVDASRIVGKRMAGGAARGGALAALMEAPISATENFIHFRRGRKSREDAAKAVAKDTAKAGATGVAVGSGMVFVVAVGGGAILAPIAMPMAVVGAGVYAVSSTLRIRRAMSDEHEDVAETDAAWVDLAFHVECPECDSGELCHDAFLNSVVASAV